MIRLILTRGEMPHQPIPLQAQHFAYRRTDLTDILRRTII